MTETMPITFDPPGLCEAVQMGVIPAGSVLTLPSERFDQLLFHLTTMQRELSKYGGDMLKLYASGGEVTVRRAEAILEDLDE